MVHHLLVLVANVLIPIAVLVFSLGFFPYKPLISGLATFDSFEDRPPRVFDKVIFMVVDALRSPTDFRSLIRSGAAIPFTAYAGSPTVTMPRLKAMTTGSVPSFLDVILNIAESDTSSTLAYQDTWLAQIRAKGEQLVMYGDDTWLKLFPGMFSRSDGTTSFFVSDFTEVDTNVTRHIHDELVTGDWSVAQVYRAMEQEAHLQSTLFILCGDHGMNDAGNHGGSSAGETSPALTFISPKLQSLGAGRESPVNATHELQYYSVVDQTDITPTLAGLLGLPIPLNSLGVFIPEFLNMWHLGSQRIRLLAGNAKQLLNALKETYPNHNFGDDTLPASCYDDSPRGPDGALCAWAQAQELLHQYGADAADDIYVQTEIESALLRFLRSSQEVMSSAASNYDLRYLLLGICIAGLAVLFSIPATYKALSNHTLPRLFLTTGVLLYGAMMFASSYVEEEQQFWYWVFTGWTFYLHVRSIRLQKAPQGATYLLPAAILAISHRFMRRWNQTGQKFAAEPDIARIYLPSHRINLWLLIVVTYADVCLHLMDNLSSLIWRLLCLAVTAMCFTFKLVFAASESPELLNETTIQTVATFMDGITLVLYARVAMGGIAVLFMLIFMRNGKLPIKQAQSFDMDELEFC
ncbi:hypothetical protein AN6496.2 [Aspergillus nidulans FGSC A4]|nr:hypothetical protein AN6496.2 [Aspergillus nidulans FGSC A4]|eukprot:XP_664100.1 hypothetical protein AN6496.2 [Aspergillus nidulans FGSC A4]